jgi:hypothetical protein
MTSYTANEFISQGSGIITLCGSTKFFIQYMEAARQLTFKGWIVLTCGSFGHSYHKDMDVAKTPEEFAAVKILHFVKIRKSQAIIVVHELDEIYIGDSTKAEIVYAKVLNLPVLFFDGETFTGECEIKPVDTLQYDRNSVNCYGATDLLGF